MFVANVQSLPSSICGRHTIPHSQQYTVLNLPFVLHHRRKHCSFEDGSFSFEHAGWLLHLWPGNVFVNLVGYAKKAVHFLVLSSVCFLYHSVLWRVIRWCGIHLIPTFPLALPLQKSQFVSQLLRCSLPWVLDVLAFGTALLHCT